MNPVKNLVTHANWLCDGRPIVTSFKAIPTTIYRMGIAMLAANVLGIILMKLLPVMGVAEGTIVGWAYKLSWIILLGMMTIFLLFVKEVCLTSDPRKETVTQYFVGCGQILMMTGLYVTYDSKQYPSFSNASLSVLAALTYIESWMYAAGKIRQPAAVAVAVSGPKSPPSVTAEAQPTVTFIARPPRFNGKAVEGMETLFAEMTGAMKVAAKADRNPDTKSGLMLYGKPGGGKTFLVEAAAGEVKLPLIVADIGKVTSMWTGQTTQLVTKLFDDALAQAPCVLFIDEVDSLLPDRGKITQAESETARIVNAMLTRTVELRGSGVVLVAATNHLQRLDQAAIRDGRFDWKIEIAMPDFKARIGLLRRGLAAGKKTASQETLERLSRHWEGFDVARMKSIGVQACKEATGAEVSGTELMNAYLAIRGNRGDPLPESTPSLAGVYLAEPETLRINGLARRMVNLIEIEEKGGTIPTGVLFYGASGTGKSLAARALAKETGWSFLSYKSPDLLASADAIDQMIDRVRDARPAIVFLDEADDLLMDRGISQNRHYTNKLLAAMDGSVQVPDVMFVAATNHPDLLDQAMLRGGRFGQKIEFTLPDWGMVYRFLVERHAAKSMRLKGIEVLALADWFDGMSFANIEEALKSAINHDLDNGGDGFITPASLAAVIGDTCDSGDDVEALLSEAMAGEQT